MYQKLYFYFPGRYLAFIKYLKTFGKIIDVRIDEICPVYNDFKIYKIKETKIEDIDILKAEKTSGSLRSFRHWNSY